MAMLPDNRVVIGGKESRGGQLLAMVSQRGSMSYGPGSKGNVISAAASGDGSILAFGTNDGNISVWKTPPEVGGLRRVDQLLNGPESRASAGEPLRTVRALTALEQMSTLDAQRLYQELANGAPGAWLTREADAARRRIALRQKEK